MDWSNGHILRGRCCAPAPGQSGVVTCNTKPVPSSPHAMTPRHGRVDLLFFFRWNNKKIWYEGYWVSGWSSFSCASQISSYSSFSNASHLLHGMFNMLNWTLPPRLNSRETCHAGSMNLGEVCLSLWKWPCDLGSCWVKGSGAWTAQGGDHGLSFAKISGTSLFSFPFNLGVSENIDAGNHMVYGRDPSSMDMASAHRCGVNDYL